MAEPARVMVVVGTRPEAIKMAPVVDALRARPELFEPRVVFTGQHTDLVEQVIQAFGMTPDCDLKIMQEGQTLYDIATRCLDRLGAVVRDERPEALLVQGDTATVCFGAMVGFFEKVPVGHVEAGLRSGDKFRPWPEETFRRVTDVLSDWYFAPTPAAARNLTRESVPADRIHITGNTVVDALRTVATRDLPIREATLERLIREGRRLVLLTAHRRESFGAPMLEIFRAVRELSERHPELDLVYPVHPNPKVREPAREMLGGLDRIHLVEPLGYTDLVAVLARAELVLTDSGGIQEEAPTFGAPVLVLRDVTERPEGVEAGAAVLVGTDRARILSEAERALDRAARQVSRDTKGPGESTLAEPGIRNPYGDGRAAERIAQILAHDLRGVERTLPDWDPDAEGDR